MRGVVQRVAFARVDVGDEIVARIEGGLLVFLGIAATDSPDTARRLARKIVELRIFEDDAGRMNRSLAEVDGALLCVSQFTLYADVRRGRRPAFDAAAPADIAEPLYESFCTAVKEAGILCARGRFGAHMTVTLANDGPVTLLIDSDALLAPRRT
jgi:D-aminoacyl-tRNA deacylase